MCSYDNILSGCINNLEILLLWSIDTAIWHRFIKRFLYISIIQTIFVVYARSPCSPSSQFYHTIQLLYWLVWERVLTTFLTQMTEGGFYYINYMKFDKRKQKQNRKNWKWHFTPFSDWIEIITDNILGCKMSFHINILLNV